MLKLRIAAGTVSLRDWTYSHTTPSPLSTTRTPSLRDTDPDPDNDGCSSRVMTRIAHLIPCATTTPTTLSFGVRSLVSPGRGRLEGAADAVTNRKILHWFRMGGGRGGDERTVSTVLRISSSCPYQPCLLYLLAVSWQ